MGVCRMQTPISDEIERRIQENTGLIYAVLKRHFYRLRHDEDFRQAGMIGLWNAARTYDPGAGHAFSTYAYACIRHTVETHRKHEARKKRAPAEPDWPLEGPVPPGIGSAMPGRAINAPDWEDRLLSELTAEETIRRIERHDPRMGCILRQRVYEKCTWQEIADRLGLSKQRVQRICRSARKYMREE